MLLRNLLIVGSLVCASAAFGQQAPKSAHADIVNAQGEKIGTAKIVPAKAGVKIELKVEKLPPGTHGFHFHTVGKCEGPDFKSAGGHFNPDSKQHGKDNPAGPHAGDMLNIVAGADGKVKTTITDASVTLGAGPNSLFHDGGTSIMIHEKEDDYKTDPSGNSGARIACGVVEKQGGQAGASTY
ncbi:MAG: superoxide dismutase family protein [Candidatus Acidiferrales bacterium]